MCNIITNMENVCFDIPVVLFTFKRSDTVIKILDVLRKVSPTKIYLFSDGPRNEKEKEIVDNVRYEIEKNINWECELIKKYFETNQGVFNQIGLGALDVFKKEKKAIFIEDDNLPCESFFDYCKDLLEKYEKNENILWICGTNYETDSSYLPFDYTFTQHMLPCGWASWSSKFSKYYQISFSKLKDKSIRKKLKNNYEFKSLYRQQIRNFKAELYREEHKLRFASWDFHMAYTIRLFNLYGIAPKYNQICNIGVDIHSTHGGVSMNMPNTAKFCGVPFKKIFFPLKHPNKIEKNFEFEKNTCKTILAPLYIRLLFPITTLVKKILGVYPDKSLYSILRRKK